MPSPDRFAYLPHTRDADGYTKDWLVLRYSGQSTLPNTTALVYEENTARDLCGLPRVPGGDLAWPTREVRHPATELSDGAWLSIARMSRVDPTPALKAVHAAEPPPLPKTLAQIVVALTAELTAARAIIPTHPAAAVRRIGGIIDDLKVAVMTAPDHPCV
jgi:hypothetical protein